MFVNPNSDQSFDPFFLIKFQPQQIVLLLQKGYNII